MTFNTEKVAYTQMPKIIEFRSDQHKDINQGAFKKRIAYSRNTTIPGKISERKAKLVRE